MRDKRNHIYSEKKEVEVEYTYDKQNNKVYDIQTLRLRFKLLLDKLKNK